MLGIQSVLPDIRYCRVKLFCTGEIINGDWNTERKVCKALVQVY